jgi:hypothetical protein
MGKLGKCSTCGKEVAVNAPVCPHCGKRYPAPGVLFSLFMLAFAGLLVLIAAPVFYACLRG